MPFLAFAKMNGYNRIDLELEALNVCLKACRKA